MRYCNDFYILRELNLIMYSFDMQSTTVLGITINSNQASQTDNIIYQDYGMATILKNCLLQENMGKHTVNYILFNQNNL